jgi:hypothetical protein
MPYARRTEGARFAVGQPVQISSNITSSHVGMVGVIVNVQPSRYKQTLDEYIVRFPTGHQATFWDIQLNSCSHVSETSGGSLSHGSN